jgi:hypothetical protein
MMIAISYRREDSLPIAGRLYDRLQAEFGKGNVFMDFDSIPYGVDFREQIKEMIERSKLVIAIIGPAWLGERGETIRRIDDPADFVRLEIAYALERRIPVIPVLINNTPMPKPEKLPGEIEALAFRNAVTLDTGVDFHHHADRLIAGIRKVTDVAKPTTPAISTDQTTADSARRQRKIVIWGAAIFLGGVVAFAAWFLARHQRGQGTYESNQPLVAKSKGDETPKPAAATAEKSPTTPSYVPIPNGYSVLQFTVSPDHRYGVLAPDADHYIEGSFQHQIVDLTTGRIIGLIQADTGFVDSKVRMNRGGINPARWSEDNTVLLWEVEGRWSPRALVLVKIANGGVTIKWQTDLLKVVQQEILARTKKAAPSEYLTAKNANKGWGSAFPDGFVVNVRANATNGVPLTFPLKVHAGLTSNPKGNKIPKGGVELNSRLDGAINEGGTFAVTNFYLTNKPGWQIALPPEESKSTEAEPTASPPVVTSSSAEQSPPPASPNPAIAIAHVTKPLSSAQPKRSFVGTWSGTTKGTGSDGSTATRHYRIAVSADEKTVSTTVDEFSEPFVFKTSARRNGDTLTWSFAQATDGGPSQWTKTCSLQFKGDKAASFVANTAVGQGEFNGFRNRDVGTLSR